MSETTERKPFNSVSPFEERLRKDMLNRIIRRGDRGKTFKAILYENMRYHEVGENYTRHLLNRLVECGYIEIVKERKRGYKTITEKENGNTRYRFIW